VSICSVDVPFYTSHYEMGVSRPSQQLTQYVTKIRNHASQTISLGWRESLCQKLMDIYSICNENGWDGYDAISINYPTVYAATILLELLPDNIEIPDVVAEPTGEIGLLWSKGKDVTFVLSVNPNTIIFAGLLGASKTHGETKLLSKLPNNIEEILLDYFSLS